MSLFHSIRKRMLERMQLLEQIDSRDRTDGPSRLQRLRRIPPETGRFIALMCSNAPAGDVVEIGTSGGYSTLWLALACETHRCHLTTFEVFTRKIFFCARNLPICGCQKIGPVHQWQSTRYSAQNGNNCLLYSGGRKGSL